MYGVGGTHGVSESLRLDLIEGRAGLREWKDVAGSRWLLVVQFSMADAPMVLREEWRSEALPFSGAALSCYTLCILACAACRTHFSWSAIDLRYEMMNLGTVVDPWPN